MLTRRKKTKNASTTLKNDSNMIESIAVRGVRLTEALFVAETGRHSLQRQCGTRPFSTSTVSA